MRILTPRIIATIFFTTTIAANLYGASNATNDKPTKKLLLSWTQSPQTSISIGFEPIANASDSMIFYDSVAHPDNASDLKYAFSVAADDTNMQNQCRSYSTSKFRYVSAQISGLKPNTKYFFRTYSNGQYSKEMYFVTAKKSGESFKLLSGGDSRSDRTQRVKMNRQMRKLVEDDPSYLGLVHGGDYVYSGKSCTDWTEWLTDHQEVITKDSRVIPIVPTFGNHENGGEAIYRRLFPHPDYASKFYYNISFGSLDFVILNSEVSTEGDQKEFLNSSLKMLSKKNSFKIVGYHRPAYPAVKRPASTKSFVSLLEKYNVPLVLESDGHSLKQTCPIRKERCEQGGVVYVGEGGLELDKEMQVRVISGTSTAVMP